MISPNTLEEGKSLEIQQGNTFLGLLKWVSESRNLSLNQIGRKTGFSRSYVSKVMSGQIQPSKNFIQAIENLLGGQQ